jgi:2,3-diketo-5-methylthio-1-phosphopentane phosphatase
MLAIGAVLVDFDGTACTADVSEALLEEFGRPDWPIYDEMVDRGEMGLREAASHQSGMLSGTREQMLAFALERCPLDPTFPSFVGWVEESGLPLAVVSDGFAFYIEPMLRSAGLEHLDVITNELVFDAGSDGAPELRHPNGHPECVGCGTCKMLAVQRFHQEYGPVVFIGEGQSDRYGALYADVVFAKDALVAICERDGVPAVPWNDFTDVRRALETLSDPHEPVAPEVCPGWTQA